MYKCKQCKQMKLEEEMARSTYKKTDGTRAASRYCKKCNNANLLAYKIIKESKQSSDKFEQVSDALKDIVNGYVMIADALHGGKIPMAFPKYIRDEMIAWCPDMEIEGGGKQAENAATTSMIDYLQRVADTAPVEPYELETQGSSIIAVPKDSFLNDIVVPGTESRVQMYHKPDVVPHPTVVEAMKQLPTMTDIIHELFNMYRPVNVASAISIIEQSITKTKPGSVTATRVTKVEDTLDELETLIATGAVENFDLFGFTITPDMIDNEAQCNCDTEPGECFCSTLVNLIYSIRALVRRFN